MVMIRREIVNQPLVWSGVPGSEGGTVTGTPGTALYCDPVYVGDAETISAVFAFSNVSGASHVKIDYEISYDYNRKDDTGTWVGSIAGTTPTALEADATDDDTDLPYAISPTLAPWIRFKFSGATSNGAYNRIRGKVTTQ